MGVLLFILFGIGLLYMIIKLGRYWFGPSEPRETKDMLKANNEFVKKMREIEKKYNKKD